MGLDFFSPDIDIKRLGTADYLKGLILRLPIEDIVDTVCADLSKREIRRFGHYPPDTVTLHAQEVSKAIKRLMSVAGMREEEQLEVRLGEQLEEQDEVHILRVFLVFLIEYSGIELTELQQLFGLSLRQLKKMAEDAMRFFKYQSSDYKKAAARWGALYEGFVRANKLQELIGNDFLLTKGDHPRIYAKKAIGLTSLMEAVKKAFNVYKTGVDRLPLIDKLIDELRNLLENGIEIDGETIMMRDLAERFQFRTTTVPVLQIGGDHTNTILLKISRKLRSVGRAFYRRYNVTNYSYFPTTYALFVQMLYDRYGNDTNTDMEEA